jgi:hypothetical protein
MKKMKVTEGRLNVFKDLGLPYPQKELVRAKKYLAKRRKLLNQIENLCCLVDMDTLTEISKLLTSRRR